MAIIQTSELTNLQLSKTVCKCSIFRPLSNLHRVTYHSLYTFPGKWGNFWGICTTRPKSRFQKALHVCLHSVPAGYPPPTCLLPSLSEQATRWVTLTLQQEFQEHWTASVLMLHCCSDGHHKTVWPEFTPKDPPISGHIARRRVWKENSVLLAPQKSICLLQWTHSYKQSFCFQRILGLL